MHASVQPSVSFVNALDRRNSECVMMTPSRAGQTNRRCVHEWPGSVHRVRLPKVTGTSLCLDQNCRSNECILAAICTSSVRCAAKHTESLCPFV